MGVARLGFRKYVATLSAFLGLLVFPVAAPQAVAAELSVRNGVVFVYSQSLAKELRLMPKFSEGDFLALTNAARLAASQAPLVLNNQLNQAAYAKAYDMATRGYWDHFRPGDGKKPWDFIREQGYAYEVAGENLARGFRTPEGITYAWLNSPSHRANIISPLFSEVGFAAVEVTEPDGGQVLLTVQMFGQR